MKLRHQQPTVWEGLFAEVRAVRTVWTRIVDELLEDEVLLDGVYELQSPVAI